MSRRRRENPRRGKQRKARALVSQNRLENILSEPWDHNSESADSAARDLLRLARRHRIGLPEGRRSWVCRGCQVALRPGINARVRIRNKSWYVTCLGCGRTNRNGSNYKRREK
ncbi:MAG: ribonuclease P Rpr2/Rpp21/SNM1 subunit [Candidatus Thalassarchaeaceae archaeon]|nr:ribonuclease P Rpr2/Rpp21/SNM1 subunit [Candidatus Thalassarchaeaceae archaeon]MDP7312278.1 ribonuclease P Rpr2/Rpp21/SNM1 subunit [Candidatus Thalassarchaeaceae archaeon]